MLTYAYEVKSVKTYIFKTEMIYTICLIPPRMSGVIERIIFYYKITSTCIFLHELSEHKEANIEFLH